MKKTITLLALILATSSINAFAGSCDYSWQKAKDGSSCGDRASDRRDGGN